MNCCSRLETLDGIEDGSITRLGFSEGYFQAQAFKSTHEEIGMQVETDPVGNLPGILPGK